jgi:hypothetical protein
VTSEVAGSDLGPYGESMSEIPLDQASGDVTAAAHDAARGKVVYLTEHGERLAAIVPAELAAELESSRPKSSGSCWRTSPMPKRPGSPWRRSRQERNRFRLSRSGRDWASTRDYPAVRAGVRPPRPSARLASWTAR